MTIPVRQRETSDRVPTGCHVRRVSGAGAGHQRDESIDSLKSVQDL